MKELKVLMVLILIPVLLFGKENVELVESIPVETTLDNPDIRNTDEVWTEMIRSAKKTLDFGQFYISHKEGEALEPVLSAIYEAADRGVRVRFIIDGNMYKTYPETAGQLDKHKNISVRVYHLRDISGGAFHTKYFMVDDKELFLGSQNFDWRALKHIHELGIRISHKKLTAYYKHIFELDWQLAGENADTETILKSIHRSDELQSFEIASRKYGKIRVIPTASNLKLIPYTLNWEETHLVRLIDSASESIQIQLLSYSPMSRGELYETLDFALRRAAARGVKVQLILSDWNFYSPRIEYIKSLHAIPGIAVKFSTIPEASEGYIGFARVEHCKLMVVDRKVVWLGTSNWSKSYFHQGRNLGIILENDNISRRISDKFLKSWNSEYCHFTDLGKTYERKRTAE
ncbi:MAG TPA: hypothetical protein ENO01_00820 [Candidatus Marinimicrobia bacterium]|nr:hypothetical protein [Candidatus Neomarinimicrobiota bacterium]